LQTKDVRIQLSSTISHPGQDEETHEIHATGQYIKKADRVYLKFNEDQSGDQVQTTVKMGEEDALIMRKGATNMRLPFVLDGKRHGTYGSGPANFNLIVKTNLLEFIEKEDGNSGSFTVNYDLIAEGSVLGEYKLLFTYTEGTL